jgi:hypothetical protein
LTDPVDLAHGPIPTNDSEQLLFRQLFPTLVHLDCQDRIRPGLAIAWTPDHTGRGWTFTLRQGVRLPDGSPLTASRVISNWQNRPGGLEALGVETAMAQDPDKLSVILQQVGDTLPRLLATPALAVTQAAGPTDRSSVRIAPPPYPTGPTVAFELVPQGADPRDAIDGGADLVVTRDAALIDYAKSQPELTTIPLPWSRTYVLLQPRGAQPIEAALDDSLRQSLARDAVRAEARPAEPPFWWLSSPACTADSTKEMHSTTSPRVAYPRGDEVARRLAERIVALAGDTIQLRTTALDPAELAAAAFKGGLYRGYIVGLPRHLLGSCRESASLPAGTRAEPLIDTRAHAILRRGSPALTIDWDGTVRLDRDGPGVGQP